MTVHVCLVSAQAAPNLLPALDPSLKPDEVVLMVSRKMTRPAQSLASVFKELGIAVTQEQLNDEHDYSTLEQAMLKVATERTGQEILLNLTGGTKLMALVAQSVAQAAEWQSFYVDVDTDSISWLDGHKPPQKLGEQLRLRHYLKSYGFELPESPSRPQVSSKQHDLTQTLITQIGSLETPITQLNWLAQQAEDNRWLEIMLNQQQQDSRSLEALLRNFENAGVLRVAGEKLIFPDESARSFAKGGWLELYAYDCVSALTGELGIRDKAVNLQVVGQEVKNELDIALMVRNRLFVVECKTARMDKPEAPKANDTLFKLAEICRRVGGLGTRGMLASYRSLRDPEKKLAAALNIELVCGRELIDLNARLKAWITR
jgi:hypothetical protein